jgi:hypothetical protein
LPVLPQNWLLVKPESFGEIHCSWSKQGVGGREMHLTPPRVVGRHHACPISGNNLRAKRLLETSTSLKYVKYIALESLRYRSFHQTYIKKYLTLN